VDILLKASGVPIDRYSYEAVELLKDTAAQWATIRRIRDSVAMSANKDPAVTASLRVPNAEIYAIDVSFAALKDEAEQDYLNRQPTSFVLPAEAVDRLRRAAGTIIADSPEFRRLLRDTGAKVLDETPRAGAPPAR
jgi:NTE family protein